MSEMSPQSPWLLSGALIVLTDTTIVPIPSMIAFQYNPATVSRSIDPYRPEGPEGEKYATVARAQPGPPTETISLTLELDATDYLEDPGNHPVGSLVGVSSPIASLEKIMYPTGKVLDAVIGAIKGALGLGGPSAVPRSQVPVVLFFWGPAGSCRSGSPASRSRSRGTRRCSTRSSPPPGSRCAGACTVRLPRHPVDRREDRDRGVRVDLAQPRPDQCGLDPARHCRRHHPRLGSRPT